MLNLKPSLIGTKEHNYIAFGWCPDCGQTPEVCQHSDCPKALASKAFVRGERLDGIELVKCNPDFLQEIRRRGKTIDFNILRIALDVRRYIQEHKATIEAQQVYYEVATYALNGRQPRTIRYWVEAIMGYPEKSLWAWNEVGLTMAHFEAARRLCRDEYVDRPSDALDACINRQVDPSRPLTVQQMIDLYEPIPTAPEEIAAFRAWLENVVHKKPPFGWNRAKVKRFEDWKEEGREFLE